MSDGKFSKEHQPEKKRGPGKLTKTVREGVLEVFNKLQEDPDHNLEKFAKKYPRDFYNIASKLIPTELTGKLKVAVDKITLNLD